jgi:preprotein translocase subunit SecG
MGILSIGIILVCVVLILIVLVQNSKGGGLASNFSSSNQILGVAKTKDILEQITWGAAGVLLLLCLLATPKRSTPVASQSADKSGKETKLKPGEESETKRLAKSFQGAAMDPTKKPQ